MISRIGVNTPAFSALLQARREEWTATSAVLVAGVL